MIDVETRQRFARTPWTLLDGLRDDSPEHRRRCAEQLITGYWGPVYAWLRRSGCLHGKGAGSGLDSGFRLSRVESRRGRNSSAHGNP